MSLQLLFWILMIVWLVFGFWSNWPLNGANGRPFGNTILIFILFAILGYAVFGSAIHR